MIIKAIPNEMEISIVFLINYLNIKILFKYDNSIFSFQALSVFSKKSFSFDKKQKKTFDYIAF